MEKAVAKVLALLRGVKRPHVLLVLPLLVAVGVVRPEVAEAIRVALSSSLLSM